MSSFNNKNDILDKLNKLFNQTDNTFKRKNYKKFIDMLNETSNPLKTKNDFIKFFEDNNIKKSSIKDKILNYIDNNDESVFGIKSETDEEINKRESIENLIKIHGVGKKKALNLYENNIKTIEDLKKSVKENPKILNNKQTIGLKYYNDLKKPIPHDEVKNHKQYFEKNIKMIGSKLNENIEYELTGSGRRKTEFSSDIDILLCSENSEKNEEVLNELIKLIECNKYIIETLAKGKKKFMGICKLKNIHRRIDIQYTDKLSYPFTLLYFTGSADFNIELRKYCLGKKLSLNEYGLKYIEGSLKDTYVDRNLFKTEEDIFKYLGLKYIEPENRNKNVIEINII